MTTVKTSITAEDIMASEPVCVERGTTLRELAQVLSENEVSAVPVVDVEGRVVGVVSMTDLLHRCIEGTLDVPPSYLFGSLGDSYEDEGLATESDIVVEDFMTDMPITVPPTATAGEIAKLMHEGRIHRVIVVDREQFPIGIVTSLDLLGAFKR